MQIIKETKNLEITTDKNDNVFMLLFEWTECFITKS